VRQRHVRDIAGAGPAHSATECITYTPFIPPCTSQPGIEGVGHWNRLESGCRLSTTVEDEINRTTRGVVIKLEQSAGRRSWHACCPIACIGSIAEQSSVEETGGVGVSGATGELLTHSLNELRSLTQRTLPEIPMKGAADMTQADATPAPLASNLRQAS
jgi:hypothetical protein